jgi:hypothetical protein
MTLVQVPVGQTLCEQVEGIYFVEKGELQKTDESKTVISAGSIFGTDSLFTINSLFGGTSGEKIISNGDGGGGDGKTKSNDAFVWHIHRQLFQAVLIHQTKKSDSKRSKILASIPMLAPLSPAQQHKVANVLKKVKFKMNETIIKQGEVGNTMFFIEQGTVVIYQKNRGEAEREEVNRHGAGGFFGEGALVNEGPNGGVRNADCVAYCDTVCYSLARTF